MPTLNLTVVRDDDPINPRNDDNLCVMACFHKRYDLGDKHKDHGINHQAYGSWAEMGEDIIKSKNAGAILPLYLYDHSGITISTSPFSCRWDSGQIGWAWISKAGILEEHSKRKYLTRKLKAWAEELIRKEVETYDRYLTGDVWGWEIKDEDGEILDSCWGYFDEADARSEGEEMLKTLEENRRG